MPREYTVGDRHNIDPRKFKDYIFGCKNEYSKIDNLTLFTKQDIFPLFKSNSSKM